MKKNNIVFSVILFVLFSAGYLHSYAYVFEVDGFYYDILNGNEVAVTYEHKDMATSKYSGNLIIPSSVIYANKNYSVTRIGERAFYNCSITSVTIPNSIKTIEKEAFYACSKITTLHIPYSVMSISNMAFRSCQQLSFIDVDSDNKVYDSRSDCNAIIETASNTLIIGSSNTIIPNNVTTIGDYAFAGRDVLTSISIPSSVITIGYSAFSSCGFENISIPSSVTAIGDYAFEYCTRLSKLTIPQNVTSIGNFIIRGSRNITQLIVDADNSKYDSRNNCNAIIETATNKLITGCKSTEIPQNINSLGTSAFAYCRDLERIVIPKDVKNIGYYAFEGCGELLEVVSEIDEPFEISSFVFKGINSSAILKVPKGTKVKYQDITSWISKFKSIEETSIIEQEPYAALSDYSTTLTFYYDNQKEARDGMSVGPFNNTNERGWENVASAITSVVFDDSFAEYTSLTSTRYWFAFCRNLTSVTGLGNLNTENVTDMGCMFEGCTGLKSLDLSAFKTDKALYMDMMFYNCSSLTSLNVNSFNTAKVIDMGVMFLGCSGLTSLDLSSFNTNNVMRMDRMFENCSGLTTIYVGDGWTTSKVAESDYMFTGCTKLVGGRGTTYNASHTDAAYAHIDGGTSNPGYFTGNNVTTVCETPQIAREGTSNYIIMTCATARASIYYTTNGTTPTENNTRYTGPITVSKNCTIKAIAVKDGYESSSVASYSVDWFKVATPTFNYSNLQLTISTATSGASIYYTTNGSTPTTSSTRYTGAITLTTDCTVKAIAVKEEYSNSDVATYNFKMSDVTCQTPTISRDGTSNQIIISCATAGANIYYTTNGTTPTVNNTKYTGPITVSKNCTIKAIAVKDGYESSSVVSYSIDWFKVATPTFSYSNLQLTISTTTSGATIYYTTNGTTPTTSSTKYTGAISLTTDCTVKAIAVKDDYTNSDVASFSFVKSNYTCQAPQISRNGTGNQIVMTCATSGASIYYTTDGTTPTQASVRYTGAITFDHNQTIRAVAIKDGMFNSSQTQFSVDWFMVATPTFSYNNLQLTISTSTSGAIIYYTIDGSNPLADLSKAIRYTVPVRLEADAQVKSVAVKTDFNNSDVASYTFVKSDYTCKSPQIQRDGSSDRVTMSSTTENAVIYYTTDGSEPTTTSTRYTGPVTMTYNCTVRAIAARSDMFSSGVSEFAVDWLTASGVTVAYNNGVLTLTCASSGAEIHYEIGGKDATKSSPLYTGPITLTDNREVRYVIYVTGMEPVSGSYTPTDFSCAPVTLSYDGMNIILSTAEEGATIYYTTDGSIPTTSSEIYRGKTPLSGLCTINAFAEKTYKNNSEMMQIPITYFFDGRTVFLSEPGHVGDAVQWRGTEGMQELTIQCDGQGVVNDKDLSALRAVKSLKHLNLVDARFENNSVPEGAFAGMNIVSVEFPDKNITTLGNVFSGCKHLAAIIWNARTPIVRTTAAAAGITNPNLLLYVDNEAYAPNDVRNVIANGSASSIVLTDSGSYYCPQEFQAQVISYSHTYTQVTGINKRSGWETIALPFDVQSITHELQGRIAPFAAADAMARPFWLGELSSSGFKRAAEIKAYTPYIISMPNNEVYGSAYILAGKVTFEASNMTVPATNIITTSKGDHVFTPCFDAVEASQSVYAINKNDRNSNHVEGSVFLPYTRDVKPFEAYIAVPTNGVAPRYIPIRDDSDTGIDYLTPDPFQNERVYDLTGRKVQGELKRGVYIINGNKVMVK